MLASPLTDALLLLLGARSKEVLARVLNDAFDCRFQNWTRDRRKRVCEELSLQEEAHADVLLVALSQLILRALGSAVNDETWLDAALPEDFHPKLRQRLAKALVAALPAWREASVASQVSLPRLLDADCRVAVAAASSAGGASSSSAVTTLRLRVEGVATRVDSVPAPRDVLVVMDRVTLAAAVHSADNLRRRLAAVAGQQGGSTAEAR